MKNSKDKEFKHQL